VKTGLIFDCDGTLVDSEGHYATVDSIVFARYGVNISPAEIRTRYMGIGLARMLHDLEQRYATVFPADMFEMLDTEVDAYLSQHLRAVAGIPAALEQLAVLGWPMAVATNSRLHRTTRNLAITGLDGFFGGRICAIDMVENPKPAPDIYLHAAGQLGIDPRACIAIEDSDVGARAAVAAGMIVIGYAPPDHDASMAQRLTQAGAHILIDDMAKLPGAIETAEELRAVL
jgi:HAD superfamily hydrolase (TIGR01509 family)